MIRPETVELVRWHAGLHAAPNHAESISGSLASGAGLDGAVASFLHALQRLNVELNGESPSQAAGEREDALPRGMVYAVAEVARMLRNEGRHEDAWAVETAWLAVLAGDVDDVPGHVAVERAARG